MPKHTRRRRHASRHLPSQPALVSNHTQLVPHTNSRYPAPHVPGLCSQHVDALGAASWPRYHATWVDWTQFCNTQQQSPWLPQQTYLHSPRLLAWAIHLFHRALHPNTAATILQKIARLSWFHTCVAKFPIGLSSGDAVALKGLDRSRLPMHRAKKTLTAAMLLAGRQSLTMDQDQSRVLWGAAVLAWFFLLRRSEYLGAESQESRHILRVKDVRFLDVLEQETSIFDMVDVVQVHVRSSKTDQRGQGIHLRLGRSGVDALCPVNAAWSLLMDAASRNASEEEPLCSWAHGKTVSNADMTTFVKTAAARCGEDPAHFSTHSLRSGGATALFRGGASDLAIQKFGRWASDTYKQYARIDDQIVLGLASRMVSNVSRIYRASATPQPKAGGR